MPCAAAFENPASQQDSRGAVDGKRMRAHVPAGRSQSRPGGIMKKNAVALVGLLVLFASVSAGAQTKMSGTLKCNKPDPSYDLDAGDRPGHGYGLEKFACSWTQPADIGADKTKDGYTIQVDEFTATRVMLHGTHVTTMQSGDKTFVAFHDAYPLKDGKPVDSTG